MSFNIIDSIIVTLPVLFYLKTRVGLIDFLFDVFVCMFSSQIIFLICWVVLGNLSPWNIFSRVYSCHLMSISSRKERSMPRINKSEPALSFNSIPSYFTNMIIIIIIMFILFILVLFWNRITYVYKKSLRACLDSLLI